MPTGRASCSASSPDSTGRRRAGSRRLPVRSRLRTRGARTTASTRTSSRRASATSSATHSDRLAGRRCPACRCTGEGIRPAGRTSAQRRSLYRMGAQATATSGSLTIGRVALEHERAALSVHRRRPVNGKAPAPLPMNRGPRESENGSSCAGICLVGDAVPVPFRRTRRRTPGDSWSRGGRGARDGRGPARLPRPPAGASRMDTTRAR